MQEVGIEMSQARRRGKAGRVDNRPAFQGKTRKDAHEAGAQAVSGTQGQGRWVTAGFEFPDLIVDVIGGAQAEIRCQSEHQGVAGAESPCTHKYSIRGFGLKVKGFVLEFVHEEL